MNSADEKYYILQAKYKDICVIPISLLPPLFCQRQTPSVNEKEKPWIHWADTALQMAKAYTLKIKFKKNTI